MRCLRQLALDDGDRYPLAAKALLSDFYMDDVLTGTDNLEETITLQKQLMVLLAKGQFNLRKWRSNDDRILDHLTKENKSDDLLTINQDEPIKTLGLLWNHKTDLLQYSVGKQEDSRITKRVVLSAIARIYDPLGLLGPVLIVAKIFMQNLWSLKVGWDESLPQEFHSRWKDYYASLDQLSELRIRRCIKNCNSAAKFDIHGFSYASEKAYGACMYVVVPDEDGILQSHIICAKSRVAPLKMITVAKLELCASLLLAKLYRSVYEAIGDHVEKIYLWSDSMIVLGWLCTCSNTLKTFVGNRVSKIQRITSTSSWHYVPSSSNPADVLSRGTTVEELKNHSLWWNGPDWIKRKEEWPEQPDEIAELPERKPIVALIGNLEQPITLPNVSSFERLVRIMACCHRFASRCRKRELIGVLTAAELERAELTVTRLVQQEVFSQEIRDLQAGKPVKQNSKLVALDPYLDPEHLVRVGRCLEHANIPDEVKHPLVLPSRHRVTKLILQAEHIRLRHCGTEQLVSSIRRKYWILSSRREARRITRSCLNCFRLRARGTQVKMGDLPEERVTAFLRPFTISGVDYAGPIQIKESRRRGRIPVSKAYIALFICFNTKAVYIELVTSLSTENFLAALRRFTGRRGICSRIFSDNGTNFVGAARELEELYKFLQDNEETIREQLARQKIEWKFIPPRAPNFGGLWEATIKSIKRQFYAVTKGLTLTFEECYTLLVEIEAVLNSRPLTQYSSDPEDLSVLTPSHFLIGDTLMQPAQKNYLDKPENRLSRWQHMQKVRQDFWKRWQHEYLLELQRRCKWTKGDNMQEGALVLLREQLPPLHWSIGRIVEVHPGSDGIVRVVTVKTAHEKYKRSARDVCPLPVDDIQIKE